MNAASAFANVADALTDRHGGISFARLLGVPMLSAGARLFAGLRDDELIVKLQSTADRGRALDLEGAHTLEPRHAHDVRGADRWIAVPVAHAAEWPALAEAAYLAARSS